MKSKEAFVVEVQYGAFYTGGQVEWNLDGSQLFCQNSGYISQIQITDNKIVRSIGEPESGSEQDEDTMYTFALSNNDETIVSSHKSGLLKLWDVSNGTLIKQWKGIHQGPIGRLAFNVTGKIIGSGGSDSVVRLWDFDNRICLAALRGCKGVISVLAFKPDSVEKLIVATGDDNKINCWNYDRKELIFTLNGHLSKVTAVSFTPNNYLVSTGRDKVVILWNLSDGKQQRVVPAYECLEDVTVISSNTELPIDKKLDSDKIYVATVGETGLLKIWDMQAGIQIYEQTNGLVTPATDSGGLAITKLLANRLQFALITVDHNILIYNWQSMFCAKQLIGFSDEILDIVGFGRNNRHIAVATNSSDIKIYDTVTMNCKIVKGHTDIVLSLSSHMNFLLSSSKDQTIRMWEFDPSSFTIRCVATGTRHTSSIGSVAFGRQSHETVASVSEDGCLKMWSIPQKFEKDAPEMNLNCTATQIAHEKDINSVTIAPNNKLVATGSQDKTAKVWSTENLQLIGVFRGHKRGIWCVRFSPTDQVLLTTSADCTMRLWSLTDMSCLKSLEGHDSSVLKAEFLTQGRQILSAGSDGLIKVWGIKTSECTVTLDAHDNRIWALSVSGDESHFYSGGADSKLVRWKDVTEERKQEEITKQKEQILEEQELSNLLAQKKHIKALKLALHLEKPATSLKIINNIIQNDEKQLKETIEKLNDNHKSSLLKHATTWNTNSRNCRTAQLVLNVLLMEILAGTFKPNGLAKTVEELLPYTERHFKRMTEYTKELKFIEYTLKCMQPNIDVKNLNKQDES